MTVYSPFEQEFGGGRLFVHAGVDPYSLVQPITRIIREMSAEQPIERPAVLEDIRAEVLAPNRLNALVFGGFALVALAIAVVGVAGVLAFSVSGRTREFAIRLAVGSQPTRLLAGVLGEGALIATAGVVIGAAGGYALARIAAAFIQDVAIPGLLPIGVATVILLVAALAASLLPAARAARVDVMEALRAD
jgi:ABC-type antimicrobial peptide transport system permease subunit